MNLEEKKYKVIIDNFLSLHSVFEAFSFILKSNETFDANEKFSKQFHNYSQNEQNEKAGSKEWEKKIDSYREKLAFEDINPFLKSFVSKLEKKKQELTDYLINESNIDSEIVSLI